MTGTHKHTHKHTHHLHYNYEHGVVPLVSTGTMVLANQDSSDQWLMQTLAEGIVKPKYIHRDRLLRILMTS